MGIPILKAFEFSKEIPTLNSLIKRTITFCKQVEKSGGMNIKTESRR